MEPAFPHTPRRRTPWQTLSARVITVISRKGGVGKTTSAVNLGAAFALSGHNVLVIGLDPQCGVAPTLGMSINELRSGLLECWERDASLTDLAHPSSLQNLFFVSPRIQSLADETRFLDQLATRPEVLIQQIDRARNLYDTILIDCPPHLGPPTRAAVAAADGLLVPAQAEELCRDSLGTLLAALDSIKEEAGDSVFDGPELEGIFLTMYNERTRMGRHVAARVAEEFGPIMLDTAVPRTTRLSEMALRGKPSVIYDRRSPGSRAYFNLADELMTRHRQRNGGQGRDVHRPEQDDDRRLPAGGLERFLGDLRRLGDGAAPDEGPDMVSLDELLAEEEQGTRGQWEGGWRDASERLN